MSEPQRLRTVLQHSKRISIILALLAILGAGLYGIVILVPRLPDLATITPHLRIILLVGVVLTFALSVFRRRSE